MRSRHVPRVAPQFTNTLLVAFHLFGTRSLLDMCRGDGLQRLGRKSNLCHGSETATDVRGAVGVAGMSQRQGSVVGLVRYAKGGVWLCR